MTSMMQMWLPVLLSAVAVFLASGFSHMALKFWHQADSRGFDNEDEVAAVVRRGTKGAGMYMLPYCTAENATTPEMKRKLAEGPVGVMFLRERDSGVGKALAQWFVLVLVITLFVAYVAANTLAAASPAMHVFRVTGTIAFMAYGFAPILYGIWFGQPWGSVFKHVFDGVIYGLLTGAIFAWLWPVGTA